jgi:hypothetical protein
MTPLRQRVIEDMLVRNLVPHTQRAYLRYVAQFASYFRKSPDPLGPPRSVLSTLLNQGQAARAEFYQRGGGRHPLSLQSYAAAGWNVDNVVPTGRRTQTLPVVMSPDQAAFAKVSVSVRTLSQSWTIKPCASKNSRMRNESHPTISSRIGTSTLSASSLSKVRVAIWVK